MASENANPYKTVDATPVKSFFVHMLTRDIRLEDAILDLLDNCVDGILRPKGAVQRPRGLHPYNGFWAEIKFDGTSFSIADNCGGIPWDLHKYAFRMGRDPSRPPDEPGTVGVYGIGMKRAIFKLGTECLITTKNGDDAYEVDVPAGWMQNETDWSFPAMPAKRPMKHDGTTIVVGALHPWISERFHEETEEFGARLERMIATHYAAIINKGFEVSVNKVSVKPRPIKLLFTENARKKKQTDGIKPFMFRTKTDGVEVFLAVGFTRPIPSLDEVENEQSEKRYSSEDAGWTIVCNDRVVVYCDRTELTGWGEANVPRYHTQFIAISGIVEFSGEASKLPTTTTKRDVDASSALYLQVKNKMREGMRIFTDYTNKWKTRADESKKQMVAGTPLSFEEIKVQATKLDFTASKTSVPPGGQYKPVLPVPKKLESHNRRISFVKTKEEVQTVGEHLLGEADADPSTVGEACFDAFLKEAR